MRGSDDVINFAGLFKSVMCLLEISQGATRTKTRQNFFLTLAAFHQLGSPLSHLKSELVQR